jgi:hypothetical protein
MGRTPNNWFLILFLELKQLYMKNTLLLLFAFFSPALFAQVMTVTVDQDDFLVCPDEIVEVVAARSTTSNNSLQFDGSSDYLEIPNNAAFNIGTTSFSVEFWVLVNTTSGLEYLSVYRNATGQGWAIWKDNSGNVGFAARDVAGAYELMTGNITEIDDGNWHHVAVTWNRGTTTGDTLHRWWIRNLEKFRCWWRHIAHW